MNFVVGALKHIIGIFTIHISIKDVIFPGLFEFSGIGKSREIVTISREFSGTGFMHNNPKYQPKFNIIKIILSTFNVMDIID